MDSAVVDEVVDVVEDEVDSVTEEVDVVVDVVSVTEEVEVVDVDVAHQEGESALSFPYLILSLTFISGARTGGIVESAGSKMTFD